MWRSYVPGNVTSFRLVAWLLTSALLFIVDNPFRELYPPSMEQWVHYIPVRSDLSNLEELVRWAQTHDAEAQAIAARARDLVLREFRVQDLYCYMGRVLAKMAELEPADISMPDHDPFLDTNCLVP